MSMSWIIEVNQQTSKCGFSSKLSKAVKTYLIWALKKKILYRELGQIP